MEANNKSTARNKCNNGDPQGIARITIAIEIFWVVVALSFPVSWPGKLILLAPTALIILWVTFGRRSFLRLMYQHKKQK